MSEKDIIADQLIEFAYDKYVERPMTEEELKHRRGKRPKVSEYTTIGAFYYVEGVTNLTIFIKPNALILLFLLTFAE